MTARVDYELELWNVGSYVIAKKDPNFIYSRGSLTLLISGRNNANRN